MVRYLLVVLPFVIAACCFYCTQPAVAPHQQVKDLYAQQLIEFANAADTMLNTVEHLDAAQWQPAFTKARFAYKAIELFADYYYPATAKAINGPPVPEVEEDDPGKVFDASGFQVMEEMLFPVCDTAFRQELILQARILQSLSRRLQHSLESLVLSDSHVFDALRLQLLRIVSMGLAGADNGISQNGVAEAVISLQSYNKYLSVYGAGQNLKNGINNAISQLQKDTSFITFNRAGFLTDYIRPLWQQLHELQKEKGIPFLKETAFINTASPLLYDSAFFNALGFSRQGNKAVNKDMVKMGELLFYDKRLSGNGLRSCATCHQPQYGYADNINKNVSVDGSKKLFRNTPTLLYAALQPVLFADGRLNFLEDQAKTVIEDHSEMKGNLSAIAVVLSKDSTYQAFKNSLGKTALEGAGITQALAAFLRTRSAFNSPFDRYLQGDKSALSSTAVQGFNLFMGKAKCGTCHFMPLFNGTVPPHYSKMEFEVLGTPMQSRRPFAIDSDEGKYRLTGAGIHRYAFKTPTVRNIALTAPYMHNGVYRTLEEVINFYDRGGGAGIGISLPNQTLPAEPLNLSAGEKTAIIEFLKSLSDLK
jgi:cytochrome c peroxidase